MSVFKSEKCKRCEGKIKESYSYCPYCGLDLRNPEKDMSDFGMLGRNNVKGYPLTGGLGGLGITDKMINSIFKSIMKSLENQMGNADPEVQNMPNGIRIKFGSQNSGNRKKARSRNAITQEQVDRMSKLPRAEAKSNVRRLSDKVVYQLVADGIGDVNDVFVSKLENGYEVKAIGGKKVYVNSIPVNLPLKGYKVTESGLDIEFSLE